MNATAPQFDTNLFTRQNMLFLTLAVLLHLFVLSGLDRDVMPDKPRLQENPIAVQFKDIPEQAEQKTVSSSTRPGPVAAPEAKPLATVKKAATPLPAPEPEPAPVPSADAPVEVMDNTPAPPAEAKPEAKAEEASGQVNKDSINTEGPQTYPVRAPQTGKISMRIVRTEPNRSPVYGDGEINWEFKTGRYKMSVEASLDLLLTSVNLYQMRSDGLIDVYGITPATSSEKRRNRSETATHFDHANKSVSFSSSNKTAEVKDGVQDKASFLMQLAGIGYADPEKFQAGREIRLQVAEERDVSTFVFIVTAYEEVETKAGKIMAWHVVRPPLPGSYNSKLEIWLAPDQYWYPIQIRNTESNGAVTTQTATKIVSVTNMER